LYGGCGFSLCCLSDSSAPQYPPLPSQSKISVFLRHPGQLKAFFFPTWRFFNGQEIKALFMDIRRRSRIEIRCAKEDASRDNRQSFETH
jgi:hypothetical protein